MASRVYWSAYDATERTAATTSYVDGVTLNFTPNASKNYAVFWSCLSQNASTSADANVRLWDGSTALVLQNWEAAEVSSPIDYRSCGGMYFFTSPGSPSAMTLKIQIAAESTNTTKGKEFSIVVLELGADDVTAEALTRTTATSSTFQTQVTLNITPPSDGDYLILYSANVDFVASSPMEAEARVDSTRVMNTDTVHRTFSKDTTNRYPWMVAFKKTGWTAAAHTADIRFNNAGGGASVAGCSEGRILALRLDAFDANYYDDQTTLNAGTQATYQDIGATASFTPAAADHLVIGVSQIMGSSNSISFYAQLLQDSTSLGEMMLEPATGSAGGNYIVSRLLDLPASSVTFKLQRKSETTSTTTSATGTVAVLQVEASASGGLSGSGTLAFSNAGKLGLARPVSAANTAAFANTGKLGLARPVSGANAVAFANAATLRQTRPLAAANAATFSSTATLTLTRPLASSNTAAFANSGSLGLARPLAGANAAAFANTGALGIGVALAGTAELAFASTASLSVEAAPAEATETIDVAGSQATYRAMQRNERRRKRREDEARARLRATLERVDRHIHGEDDPEPEVVAAVAAAREILAQPVAVDHERMAREAATLAEIRAAIVRLEAVLRDEQDDEEAAEMMLLAA